MSVDLQTEFGYKLVAPDGSKLLDDSSAGPGSAQFMIPVNTFVTAMVDNSVSNYADTISWTESLARYYTREYQGEEIGQGAVQSEGKESYAVAVKYVDQNSVKRVASCVGVHFNSGGFLGIAVLTVDAADQPSVDAELIRSIVDGLELTE